MRKSVILALLLALGCIQGAQAQTSPGATCESLKAAYSELTSGPISAEDGSLSVAINALADSGFMWKDKTYTARATREDIAQHLQPLPPHDALVWVYKRYAELEDYLKRNCQFKADEHKDIRLMAPKPVTPKCKAPAELPKQLLK